GLGLGGLRDDRALAVLQLGRFLLHALELGLHLVGGGALLRAQRLGSIALAGDALLLKQRVARQLVVAALDRQLRAGRPLGGLGLELLELAPQLFLRR